MTGLLCCRIIRLSTRFSRPNILRCDSGVIPMAECCLLLRQRQPHFVHPKLSLVQLTLQEETLHLHPLQPLNFTARLQKLNMELHAVGV